MGTPFDTHVLQIVKEAGNNGCTANTILGKLRQQQMFLDKKTVNQILYSMQNVQLYMISEYAGSPKWYYKEINTTNNSENNVQEPRMKTTTPGAYLYVDLDQQNRYHDKICKFRGTSFGFCNQYIGSEKKFPHMKVHIAEWNSKQVTDYMMTIHSYELIKMAEPGTLEIWVLSCDESLQNIVHFARKYGHKAKRVICADNLPLINEVAVPTLTEFIPPAFVLGTN